MLWGRACKHHFRKSFTESVSLPSSNCWLHSPGVQNKDSPKQATVSSPSMPCLSHLSAQQCVFLFLLLPPPPPLFISQSWNCYSWQNQKHFCFINNWKYELLTAIITWALSSVFLSLSPPPTPPTLISQSWNCYSWQNQKHFCFIVENTKG